MRTLSEACEAQNEINRQLDAYENRIRLTSIRLIMDKLRRRKLSPREALKSIEEVLK